MTRARHRSVCAVVAVTVCLCVPAAVAAGVRAATRTVPRVIGLNLGQAYTRLHRAGLKVTFAHVFFEGSFSCAPVVGSQTPAGAASTHALAVTLTPQTPRCALGSPAVPTGPLPSATVPDFDGKPVSAVVRWATSHDLYWQANRLPALHNGCWPGLLQNYAVMHQTPKPGATLKLGIGTHHGNSGSFKPTPVTVRADQRSCSSA